MNKTMLLALCSLLFTVGLCTPAPAQIVDIREISFPEIPEEICQDITEIQKKNDMFKRDSKDNRIITLGKLKYFLDESYESLVLTPDGRREYKGDRNNFYRLYYNGKEPGSITITRYAHDVDFSIIEEKMQDELYHIPSCILTDAPFGKEHICTVIADDKYVVSRLIQTEDGSYYLFTVTDFTIRVRDWEGGEDAQTRERWQRLFRIVQNTKPKVITQGFVDVDVKYGRDSYYN